MATYERHHIIVNEFTAQRLSELTGRSIEDLERGNGLIVAPLLPCRPQL
jgi:hypothetical protein